MIKFSQFFRASVMTLVVGFGGMAAASPALAHNYSSADLAAAQSSVDQWRYMVEDEQSAVDYYNAYLGQIQTMYDNWVFSCHRSIWSGENYRLECLRDAYDWKEEETAVTNDNIIYHSIVLSYNQDEYYAAISWRDTVQADCCSDL